MLLVILTAFYKYDKIKRFKKRKKKKVGFSNFFFLKKSNQYIQCILIYTFLEEQQCLWKEEISFTVSIDKFSAECQFNYSYQALLHSYRGKHVLEDTVTMAFFLQLGPKLASLAKHTQKLAWLKFLNKEIQESAEKANTQDPK